MNEGTPEPGWGSRGLNGVVADPEWIRENGTVIVTTGTELGDQWRTDEATIIGYEGGIGPDRLGAAFRGTYQAKSTVMQTLARLVPDHLIAKGEATQRAGDLYDAGDRATAEEIFAAGGGES